MMSAFQVGLGLLLLSVGAATSLAEERVRGSLDVLLVDPDVDALDPGRQVVGHASGRSARSCSGRRCWAACCSSNPGTCSAISC